MYTGNLQPSAPASATNADDKHELFNDAERDDAHRSEEARRPNVRGIRPPVYDGRVFPTRA